MNWRHTRHRLGHRLRHSIKARLVLLFVLMGLGTAAVFLFGMQRVVQGGWQTFARPLLADYVDRLAEEIGSPPSVERARALTERLPIRVRIDGPALHYDSHPHDEDRRWADGGERDPYRERSEPNERGDRVERGERGDRRFDAESWGLTRQSADGHRVTFGLARPPDAWRAGGRGWLTLAALLALTLAAYAAVRHLLRPLEGIGAAVQRYGRGEFGEPIAVRRQDELGELATRINHMAASLHGMLEAKRALLLAISHELRSPLTRARLNAELLGDSPERPALLRDLGEMRDLITGLLESERLGDGHAALHSERTDLAAMVREWLATSLLDLDAKAALDAKPSQDTKADPGMKPPLDMALDLEPGIGAVQVDPMRLRLLLRNLIENARRHAGAAAGPATVFLRREAGGALALGVRDQGPGVAPERLARLGEAFYRPDSARTRAEGGVGLGLHLCRLVAQAHGGELRIHNLQPGLEVAMVWTASENRTW